MMAQFEEARLALARLRVDEARLESEVVHRAAQISARALGVDRVGVWMLPPGALRLECVVSYGKDGQAYDVRTEIPRCDAGPYFAALTERRVIATDDAIHDPVTSCLAERYLAPRSIGAMLDAPIYLDGHLHGVVCHEHVGGVRKWTQFEIDFAATFADVLAGVFLQRRLREQEAQVRQSALQLQDAAKLAMLTHVTRAFAHDVNNALTVAVLTANRLESMDSPELVAMGRELAQTSEFAGRVLRELQEVSRRDGADVVAIGVVIEAFRPVLLALVRGIVTLTFRIAEPGATTAASRTQVEQILLNLCLNARDASPTGGEVVVSTFVRDRMLVIEVEDHGVGIAPELLPTIFDAYVTTKSNGSGIGLAIVRGIVNEQGGRVDVASTVGRGTTFHVELPLR
jgi:two-component system, cell cycle sensor histidine kinase and response regulator CckA